MVFLRILFVLSLLSPLRPTLVTGGFERTCLTLQSRYLGCFGNGDGGSLGRGSTSTFGSLPGEMSTLTPLLFPSPLSTDTILSVSMSSYSPAVDHVCALFQGGGLSCWGGNAYGQCGAVAMGGSVLAPSGAVNGAATEAVVAVAAMAYATCVVMGGSGAVRCWGFGGVGQLGTGSVATVGSFAQSMPIAFSGSDTVKSLSGFEQFCCALFASMRVKCWGINKSGQLGQGHTATIGASPSDMSNLPYVAWSGGLLMASRLSAGDAHTCAVTDVSQQVVCWGLGTQGQLGRDSTLTVGGAASDMPALSQIAFSTSDPALEVSAGSRRTCAVFQLSGNGAPRGIRCWGEGLNGKLGNNQVVNIGDSAGEMSSIAYITFSDTVPPVAVSAAGGRHTCVVFTNDRARCFGGGIGGALGLDSTLDWAFSTLVRQVSTVPYISIFPMLSLGVTAVAPASGSLAGGDPITLFGQGLFANNSLFTVRFFDPIAPADRVDVVGTYAGLTATSGLVVTPVWPHDPADVMVSVSWDGVDFNLTASGKFSFAGAAVVVTAVTPTGWAFDIQPAPVLLLVGSGFRQSPRAVCRFGGNITTALTAVTATAASCPAPVLPTLFALPLSVSLNNYTFSPANLSVYTFDLAIAALSVSRGPASGGTPVAVTLSTSGYPFFPGWALVARFNLGLQRVISTAASLSGSMVRLTSPAVTGLSPPFVLPGTAQLEISLDGGLSFASAGFEFYADPGLLGVNPAAVPADNAGGVEITVSGINFAAYQGTALRVIFASGAMGAVVLPADFVSSFFVATLPDLDPPASAVGVASVFLSLNGGVQWTAGVSLSLFMVSSVSPPSGPVGGGTAVEIAGVGFSALAVTPSFACRFQLRGRNLTTIITRVTSTTLSCSAPGISPTGASGSSISVTYDGRTFSQAQLAFEYYKAAFSALLPASAPANATGVVVTVTGSGFPANQAARCRFEGAVALAALSANLTAVICPVPKLSGTVSLSVALNWDTFEATGLSFTVLAPTGQACQPGSVADPASGVCVPCPAGWFSADGVSACQPCPRGRFARLNASSSCDVCRPGEFAAKEGSAGCVQCGPGSFAALNESSSCAPCPQGRFASGNGSTACEPCRAGERAEAEGSAGCVPCEPGSYAAKNESSVCIPCPPGQFAANGSSSGCEVCPSGRVARRAGASACEPCQRGTFSVEGLTTSCPDCPLGTYSDVEEALACRACPAGTVSVGIPSSAESCVCSRGFFRRDGRLGKPCENCPAGGSCNGTNIMPVPEPGYWGSARSPFAFIRCEPPEACPGWALDRCGAGYRGRMCSQCEAGWFRAGGACKGCPKGAPGILFAFVLFSVVIVLLLVKFGGRRSAKAYGGTIGIATKFFQVLAVIGRLDVLWPSSVKDTIATLTTPFSLKFDTLGPECSAVSIRYEHKWGFTMLLPVFFAAIFALVYIGAWAMSKARKHAISASLKNRIVNGYLSLLSLGFLTLATTALEPFGCRLEKDDRWTLVADPSRLCFERWWKELVPFAVIGIVVYILGIPLTLLWWLRRNRSNLSNPEFIERYGGLYSTYSQGCFAWEPAVMAEKVAIAAIGLLLNGFVMLQVILLQGLFVLTLSVYQSYSPYARGKDNRLHAVLRWCSLVVLFSANLFRADQFPSAGLRRAAEWAALLFVAGAVLVIVLSTAYNLWQIRKALKDGLSQELEKAMGGLINLAGRVAITKWLGKSKGQVGELEKLVKELSASPGAPSTADPESDLIVSVFTSGVLTDEAVPAVRAWVCERLDRPGDLRPFIETFTAIGRVAGPKTSPQTSSPLMSATTNTPSKHSQPLFQALFGFTPHNPAELLRPEYLFASQGVLLATATPPKKAPPGPSPREIELTTL
jgi:alpha-tubulin suppressor-like RCC1 family protein